jgi:hypothetical protein
VNTQTFTHAHPYNKFMGLATGVVLTVAVTVFSSAANAEWKVDLSRRQKEIRQVDMNDGPIYGSGYQATSSRSPASTQPIFEESAPPTKWPTPEIPSPAPQAVSFDASEPVTEVVILNTNKGFVPNTLRLRKDVKYKVNIVNVNEKEKNISFVLDGFSEHQSTYYGKVKSFYLQPTREGVYSYQCPETSIEGRLVVFAPPGAANIRTPASEGK